MSLFPHYNVRKINKYLHWDTRIFIRHLEDTLDIELEDYARTVEGRVTMREGEDDQVIIKIKALGKYEEAVLELLKDHFNEEKMTDNVCAKVPPEIISALSEEFETKEWRYTFSCSVPGKYAKTRTVYIFVAYDEDGMYAYFWE